MKYPALILRRAHALLLMLLCGLTALAEHPLNIPGADRTHVGIYIEELASGRVLADYNSTDLFIPASVMKSVTSAAATLVFESTGRFSSPVNIEGSVVADTLEGNIVVMTIGDPTIESVHFKEYQGLPDSIASRLQQMGVKAVRGCVIIDESYFTDATVPKGWSQGDLSTYYGTLIHGANYRGNASGKSAVKDPAAQMRRDIVEAMTKRGIQVMGIKDCKPSAERSTLYTQYSPTVQVMLHSLMVRSDNMMAEAMLRALEPGCSRDQALASERDILTNLGLEFTDGIAIYDGSGLSRSDRLSPRWVAQMYKLMYLDPECRRAYSDLFPRAGREGTMRGVLKDTRLEGRVATKTGSMTGVQCFGGYLVDDAGNPTHVIAVFVNDFTCDRARLKAEIGRFLLDTLPE